MNNTTKRFRFTKFGLAENPVGWKVTLPWSAYASGFLMGDVVGVRVERAPHGGDQVVLDVRHFNGEAWPVSPLAASVEVIR